MKHPELNRREIIYLGSSKKDAQELPEDVRKIFS